jgi:Uma2 family endonuclease
VETDKDLFVEPEEYEKLQDTFKCKTEYDNGRIIMHSGTSINHNNIVLNINMYLRLFLKNSKCNTFTEQIEVIFNNGKEEYKYKPDVFVVCEESTRKGESFTSAPKIIFEVVSKSTASHDYITKLAVYQKFQVLEYNIVEPNGYIVQYGLMDGAYQITNTFHQGDTFVSFVFDEFKMKLQDIFE